MRYGRASTAPQARRLHRRRSSDPAASSRKWRIRPIFQGIKAGEGDHMILSQGAVPIEKEGQIIGAVGVGGGTGEQDEECAVAGAAAA